MGRFKKLFSPSVVLVICTILALICANVPIIKDWYFSLWKTPVSLSIGDFNIFSHNGHSLSLMEVINDLFMAVFFLSVGLEIKREILVGELSSMKKAMLPVIGACGGMIVPVLIFWLICPDDPVMTRGMAIPMATDIAFSLGILSLFKTRVPIGLKMFLAALAVADDLGGIIIIALFYASSINYTYLALAALMVLFLILANLLRVRYKTYYIVVGLILWYFMLQSGIHSTISGVVLAFCVPATIAKGTGFYLERIRKSLRLFPDSEDEDENKPVVLRDSEIFALNRINSAANRIISPLQDFENHLHIPVNYCVVPLFAFANAGIDLSLMTAGDLISGVSLAVIAGLVIGKFVGVFSFSWLAVKAGLVSLPQNADWRSFASVCVVCGIGFTVSMFIADLSYMGAGEQGYLLLSQAKLGVLSGSIISAILACICLNFTLPKTNN